MQKPILIIKMKKGFKTVYVMANKNNVSVECSFEWNAGYAEEVLPFTNNIPQKDGGTTCLVLELRYKSLNKYSADRNSKKNKITLSGEDIKEGLTAVLSIKMPDPKFSSKQKTNLSSEIRISLNTLLVKRFQHGLTKILNSKNCFRKNYSGVARMWLEKLR